MLPEVIEVVVAVADVLRADGTIFPASELQKLADGRRYFWDEARQSLIWRGPISELKDERK